MGKAIMRNKKNGSLLVTDALRKFSLHWQGLLEKRSDVIQSKQGGGKSSRSKTQNVEEIVSIEKTWCKG